MAIRSSNPIAVLGRKRLSRSHRLTSGALRGGSTVAASSLLGLITWGHQETLWDANFGR